MIWRIMLQWNSAKRQLLNTGHFVWYTIYTRTIDKSFIIRPPRNTAVFLGPEGDFISGAPLYFEDVIVDITGLP